MQMSVKQVAASGLVPVDGPSCVHDDDLVRSEQVLEPGYYWTAKRDVEALRPEILAGDTLLLVDLTDFEDKLHSVTLLYHPRNGEGRYTILIDEFIADFDPCRDGDGIRAAEQQQILDRVNELQRELVETQMNPQRMLEAVQPVVDEGAARREREDTKNHRKQEESRRERERNLSKIHRRAARRSAAKGNPLALPKVAVGTNVSQLLTAGIDEGGVIQLRDIADRQLVLAQAQANWLTAKTEQIGKTLKQLAPYASEKAAVALARSSDALKRAAKIKQGIESLDLYTGKGVDVFEVRSGPEAPSHVPLMIVQGKRFMEEELAARADVHDGFDWRDQKQFFAELAVNAELLEQVFPSQRCVVSMAVTRSTRRYEDPWSAMIHNLQNQLVFLLVRNGGMVHVVYSATPSHEAADRLFPTRDGLGELFRGVDGSTITLRDVEFGEASKRFDDLALHYRRFLILLCGLDHRERLLGTFYPPDEQIRFMTSDFQSRFMRFYADDEVSNLLDDGMPPVSGWMREKNKMVQSGSRVFVTNSTGAASSSPEVRRRHGLKFRERQFDAPVLATQEGHRFLVTLETHDTWERGSAPNVKCYLDAESSDGELSTWWLCLDGVKASEIQRYLASRRNWAMGVGYLRLFRRLVVYLTAEAETEAAARDYLMTQATTHGGMPVDVAADALDVAVRNWRAARRGAPLPGLDRIPELNDVLSLMAPPGYIPPAIRALVESFVSGQDVAGAGREPLLLTRAGPTRYVLYTSASAVDRAAYPDVLHWGWVRRVVLEPTKTAKRLRQVSEGFDWLGAVLPASEVEVRRWEAALPAWQNKEPEPIKLRKYAEIKENLLAAATVWESVLRAGPGVGVPDELFQVLLGKCRRLQLREQRHIAYLSVAIPVAVYGSGRKMTVVYMSARAEKLLHVYGSAEQREVVEKQFAARFADRAKGMKILKSPLRWNVTPSDATLDGSHTDVHKGGIAGWTMEGRSWMKIAVKVNHPRSRGKPDRPGKKGNGKPSTHNAYITLGLNRAFDELAGVGPILRRRFYEDNRERAVRDTRAPFTSYGNDPDGSKGKAERARILGLRYTVTASLLSELVWSPARGRSVAQSVFDGPLHAAGMLSKERDDY